MKPTTLDEQLLILVNTPQWKYFIEHKQRELDAAHKELEWMSGDAYIRTQGRVIEIRKDLNLKDKLFNIFDKGNV